MWIERLTSMSSPSCIFLIHLLACPCGSIIKGHLVPLVTKMAESVDTCMNDGNVGGVQAVQGTAERVGVRQRYRTRADGGGSASSRRENISCSCALFHVVVDTRW